MNKETGEIMPRIPLGVAASQVHVLTEQKDPTLFDECMQFLENFPMDMSALSVTPDKSPDPTASRLFPAKTSLSCLPDLEHTWMELLSLPELQCLPLPDQNGLTLISMNPQFFPDPRCDMPSLSNPEGPDEMTLQVPELSDALNPNLSILEVNHTDLSLKDINVSSTVIKPPSKGTDVPEFGIDNDHQHDTTKHPGSHSGLSQNVSQRAQPIEGGTFSTVNAETTHAETTESVAISMNPSSAKTFLFTLSPPGSSTPTHFQRAKVTKLKAKSAKDCKEMLPLARGKTRALRDEQQAQMLCIPFAVDTIVNLPTNEFNDIVSQQQLSDTQLALVRDIRRRGKNKVAALNCRKRKMESILTLEQELDILRDEQKRLLLERMENDGRLQQAKRQLRSLYREAFGLLRDEAGQPLSPSKYSLHHNSDGHIVHLPQVQSARPKAKAKKYLW